MIKYCLLGHRTGFLDIIRMTWMRVWIQYLRRPQAIGN